MVMLLVRLLEMFLVMRIMGMLMIMDVTKVTAVWGLKEGGNVHHGGVCCALLTGSRGQHKVKLNMKVTCYIRFKGIAKLC